MTENSCPITNGLPTFRERPFDPPDTVRDLQKEQPICRMTFPDGVEGWLVTGYRQGREILADHRRFSSDIKYKHMAFPSDRPADLEADIPGLMEHMDPPDHTRIRRRLTGQFTLRKMRQLTPRIEKIAADYAEAMISKGPPADLVTDFALPVSSKVICELLGVPFGDRERFESNSDKLLRLEIEPEEARAAAMDITELVGDLLQRKMAEPADDVFSVLVEAEDLSQPEMIGATLMLLVAGHVTTANTLALGTFALLSNPDQLALLRADESLVESTVEELLRYLTVVHIGVQRTPLEDVEIDGVTLPAGEPVLIHLPSINRDPGQFANPDRLDITHGKAGHLTFSHGIHQCLGQQLARLELGIGLTTLLRRFPDLRLAEPAESVPMRSDMTVYGVHRPPVTW